MKDEQEQPAAIQEEPVESPEVKQETKLQKRDEFFKNPTFWIIVLLIGIMALGAYIRIQPMTDHNGNPGLWDVTTNIWTLGPDLDPWLFFRAAEQILEEGRIPEIDSFRSVPRGAFTSYETKLLPYMIVWTYYGVNLFGNYNIEYAAVIFPVIMFVLTTLAFFLFTREIFTNSTKKSKLKANIIALIASFLFVTVPALLNRTIAGIPEKESAAFLFVFLTFYFYIKAYKSSHDGSGALKPLFLSPLFLSLLAGISTGLLALIWGGYLYIFLPIAIATMGAFILNKITRKEFWVYTIWLFSSFIIMLFGSARYTGEGMLTSLAIGPAFLVYFILVVHLTMWDTPLKKYFQKLKEKSKYNLPNTFISLFVSIILILIGLTLLLGPSFIIDKAKSIHQAIFKPVYGRWNTTVAENRQPFFTDWMGTLGPMIGGFPLLFWLSFVGAIALFKKMLESLKKKDSWALTGFFVFFLSGLVFSRFASNTIFNGANFISTAFYYVSTILFVVVLVKYYLKYYKNDDKSFEEINYKYIIILSLYVICLFTSRGAIRLLIVLSAVCPILIGYLCIRIYELWDDANDDTAKVIYGALMITIICLTFFTGLTFYRSSVAIAYNFVPGGYNIQWQKAMDWTRDSTPTDSVFISWWDYGYWIQSIGERATVLDGGNTMVAWNYWTGRLVLTGDNESDLREFSYNHNVTHLLIDSTDLAKYGAFSSIGSNENYDRLSYLGTFLQDQRQTQELKNKTQFIYTGGIGLDEDTTIEGGNVFLPAGNAGIGMMLLP